MGREVADVHYAVCFLKEVADTVPKLHLMCLSQEVLQQRPGRVDIITVSRRAKNLGDGLISPSGPKLFQGH